MPTVYSALCTAIGRVQCYSMLPLLHTLTAKLLSIGIHVCACVCTCVNCLLPLQFVELVPLTDYNAAVIELLQELARAANMGMCYVISYIYIYI
jgi:hypothetical protein